MGSESKNWTECCVEDIAAPTKHSMSTGPFGSAISSKFFREEGVPVIRGRNLSATVSEKIVDERWVYVTPEKAKEHERSLVRDGDLVFTCWGTIDQVGLIDASAPYPEFILSNKQMKLTPDNTKATPLFLYYLFSDPIVQEQILRNDIGSTIPGFNLGQLKAFKIRLPPLAEQKAIAQILGSLDDKIELNRRMNETLESMAQALFKSWFVDFDPVIDNALAAGNPIPEPLRARAETRLALGDQRKPLPDEIQKLFPDAFVFDDEMGWMPDGWGTASIAEMVESVSVTYPLKTVDEVVFLNTGDILNGNFLHNDRSKVDGLPGQAKKSIQRGDILFSEIRPQNRRHAFVDFDASEYVVSTKLMVLRSRGRFESLFAYFLLKQESTIRHLQMLAESRSGTFPQITFSELETVKFTLPYDSGLLKYFFLEVLNPYFTQCRQRECESASLTKLRDTLLPQLLSGELRIPDAEKLVADSL